GAEGTMSTSAPVQLAEEFRVAARALERLERLVATVHGPGPGDPRFDAALAVLQTLSRKEGVPIAIVGGLAAIYHGYKRFTKDIDIVVGKSHLDTLIRVAPHHTSTSAPAPPLQKSPGHVDTSCSRLWSQGPLAGPPRLAQVPRQRRGHR